MSKQSRFLPERVIFCKKGAGFVKKVAKRGEENCLLLGAGCLVLGEILFLAEVR